MFSKKYLFSNTKSFLNKNKIMCKNIITDRKGSQRLWHSLKFRREIDILQVLAVFWENCTNEYKVEIQSMRIVSWTFHKFKYWSNGIVYLFVTFFTSVYQSIFFTFFLHFSENPPSLERLAARLLAGSSSELCTDESPLPEPALLLLDLQQENTVSNAQEILCH